MYWLYLFTWWLYISFILYFFKLNPFNPYVFYIGIVLRDILFIILNFRNPKPIGSNSMFTSVFKFILLLLVHYIPFYYLYNTYIDIFLGGRETGAEPPQSPQAGQTPRSGSRGETMTPHTSLNGIC